MHSSDRLPSAADLAELRALEESLWRTETLFNQALMDQTFAPDFIEFGRSGRTYSRTEILSALGAPGIVDSVLPLVDFHVRLISDDVAQVTYVSEVFHDGAALKANRSSIWSRIDSRWRLRFHQGTPVSANPR